MNTEAWVCEYSPTQNASSLRLCPSRRHWEYFSLRSVGSFVT